MRAEGERRKGRVRERRENSQELLMLDLVGSYLESTHYKATSLKYLITYNHDLRKFEVSDCSHRAISYLYIPIDSYM